MNWHCKLFKKPKKMSHTYVGISKTLTRERVNKKQFVAHIKERGL